MPSPRLHLHTFHLESFYTFRPSIKIEKFVDKRHRKISNSKTRYLSGFDYRYEILDNRLVASIAISSSTYIVHGPRNRLFVIFADGRTRLSMRGSTTKHIK
uniref:AlNc14C63G4545 protein n=1 Tax=Albugo laibachii Nc14 TaxID=890382 RepID=F0WD23_9STRA|nr:AlNc14C63G4545 [Albugo laibachii Nc14]|eukprot:CCA19095.1 AlNc14C63G4545 [Albugo laibachii Nc14]